MSETTWPALLSVLVPGEDLSKGEAAWAMESIMAGDATPAQFAAFVTALRAKGETVEEMVGLVEVMRRLGQKVQVEGPVVDTCGTGGDRAGTINISTIAAFVVAGAGGRVAKHGNRSASSHCGSADLLEELGVKIDLGPEGVARCIDDAGIGFCFAPVFHPSMRHAAAPRKELGIPTVFNFLGPLTNPAGAAHQAIGVSDPAMAPKMVEVLRRLGSVHVLAFHGADGLDELTITGPSAVWELKDGRVEEKVFDPGTYGIEPSEASALLGGDPPQNAGAARRVLDGEAGPARDVVIVNAAAALVAADIAGDFPAALDMAHVSIDSGKAAAALKGLIEISNE